MTKRRRNLTLFSKGGLLLILLLAVAMPGCKKKNQPPPQVTPLPTKTEQKAVAPVAVPVKTLQTAPSSARKVVAKSPVLAQISTAKRFDQAATINLDFTNRRDPFKPFASAPTPQKAVVSKASKGRIKDPLPIQSFDTEKFKVSGIVTGYKENSALVIDPNGKGYVVKEGMPMGSNDGFVKRVTNSTVEVEERFTDDSGRVRKRLVKIMLLRKK